MKKEDLAPYYRVMKLRFEAMALAEEQQGMLLHPLFQAVLHHLDEAAASIGKSYGSIPKEALALRQRAIKRLLECQFLLKALEKENLLPEEGNDDLQQGIAQLEASLEVLIELNNKE